MTVEQTILITGAAGRVAAQLLPSCADLPLRLTDRTTGDWRAAGDSAVGDLNDPAFARDVLSGVAAVVHLAGQPRPRSGWDALAGPNVSALGTLLDAAAEHRVPRLVLASSVHAAGGHLWAGRVPIDPAWPPSPCCRYGATKAFAEAAGREHAHRTGASVVCLRLGATKPLPPNRADLPLWLAPPDLGRLVRAALTADVGVEVCHGISANAGTAETWSLANNLGYRPACDSSAHAGTVGPYDGFPLCPPGITSPAAAPG